jgi:hypothetical protein
MADKRTIIVAILVWLLLVIAMGSVTLVKLTEIAAISTSTDPIGLVEALNKLSIL